VLDTGMTDGLEASYVLLDALAKRHAPAS